MLLSVPKVFALLCLVSIVVADDSLNIAGPNSCPKPKKLNEDERLFMIRVSLIRSMGQLKTVCSDSETATEYEKQRYGSILTFRAKVCAIAKNAEAKDAEVQEEKTFESKLIDHLIAINILPVVVCGPKYMGYRWTLQNKLMKPNGEIANRLHYRTCYSDILASEQYKKLAGKLSHEELIESLDLKALQLHQMGEGALSCAVSHLKDDFKRFLASAGVQETTGTVLMAAGIAGMLIAILSVGTLGVGAAFVIAMASFVVGSLLAVFILTQDRANRSWMAEQCEYMEKVAQRSTD